MATAPMVVTTLMGSGGGIQAVTIVERDVGTVDELTAGVSVGTVLAESTMIARDLVNHPANVMTPTKMAGSPGGRGDGRTGTGRDGPRPDAGARHGAFLGVAQGSEEPPQLIVMTYRGDPDNPGQ